VTEVKFNSRLTQPILDALEPHAHAMFSRQGSTWMAVVEFEAGERTETVEVADDVRYVVPKVRLRIRSLEVATGDDAHRVRAVQQALYSKRTGGETLPLDVAETELRYAADLIGDDR